MKNVKTRRNDPCPCGSGKKYKQCCEGRAEAKSNSRMKWLAIILGGILLLGGLSFVASLSNSEEVAARPNQVWSPEHGHWHDAP